MTSNNSLYRRAKFILGAAGASQFPDDVGSEVAFVGRSNAGKSSALNTIADQRSLARVSKAPGRTQQINFFELDVVRRSPIRLVDLPGYGYAKAAASVRKQWDKLMSDYFQARQSLKGVVLIVDIRRLLGEGDQHMLAYCLSLNLPVHILLSKADKLSRGAASAASLKAQRGVEALASEKSLPVELVSFQLFSSLKKTGLAEAIAQLDCWLLNDSDK
ncbi:MAG: YihA family ribosome biogenesis GTP-binding protein [Gammaproteobacteria bacterium]|nr:YihA family ribosome biogenesis GTP-binding protein [Gammaproteobacteria bacterium]